MTIAKIFILYCIPYILRILCSKHSSIIVCKPIIMEQEKPNKYNEYAGHEEKLQENVVLLKNFLNSQIFIIS